MDSYHVAGCVYKFHPSEDKKEGFVELFYFVVDPEFERKVSLKY